MFNFKDNKSTDKDFYELSVSDKFEYIESKPSKLDFRVYTVFGIVDFNKDSFKVNGDDISINHKIGSCIDWMVELLRYCLSKKYGEYEFWELEDIISDVEDDKVIALYINNVDRIKLGIELFRSYPIDSLIGAIMTKSKKYQQFDDWIVCFDEKTSKKSEFLNGKFYRKLNCSVLGIDKYKIQAEMAIHNAGNKMFYIDYKTNTMVCRQPSGDLKKVTLSNGCILAINDYCKLYMEYDDTKLILPSLKDKPKKQYVDTYHNRVEWLKDEKIIDEINQVLKNYVKEIIENSKARIRHEQKRIDKLNEMCDA